MTFETYHLRVHSFVGFEVVEHAACAPRPGRQPAPIIGLAMLTLVDKPDDAGRQPTAVIRLHTSRVEGGVAPAAGEQLRARSGRTRRGGSSTGAAAKTAGRSRAASRRWRRRRPVGV